jgi:FlaA1/EpsC-like NDP-sugar epimerase
MPVIRIFDLAKVMIREIAPVYGYAPKDIDIKVIGIKPGEKLYEELMSHEETRRSWELDRYFVNLPAFTALYRNITYSYKGVRSYEVDIPYNSTNEKPLSQEQLRKFLIENNLLYEDPQVHEHPAERFWPDPETEISQRL